MIHAIATLILDYVAHRVHYLLDAHLYPTILRRKRGLLFAGKFDLIGLPIIEVACGATIRIGDNVTLRSRNEGYHLNMHSPLKLVASRPDAVIDIGDNTRIGGACLHARHKITIGKNCLIAANTQIFDASGHDLSFQNVENRVNTRGETKPIHIEDNVWIGANCIILPGVRVGYGSVVAAGSVVFHSIPSYASVAGNPAKVLLRHQPDAQDPAGTSREVAPSKNTDPPSARI